MLRKWISGIAVSRMVAVMALLLSASAQASSLQVSPVMLTFQASQFAQGITLRNTGNQPITGQVRVFAWSQNGKDDGLEPVQVLVASPPLVVIPPQGEQLVRVVRVNHKPIDREQTYRLLIDELPPPAADASSNELAAGINFRLRYSVPVFISAPGVPSEPKLDWTLKQHDGGWFLGASNHGATHAQLSAVTLQATDGKKFEVAHGLLGYALAGSGREWRLPDQFPAKLAAAAGLTIQTNVNTNAWPMAPVIVSGK